MSLRGVQVGLVVASGLLGWVLLVRYDAAALLIAFAIAALVAASVQLRPGR